MTKKGRTTMEQPTQKLELENGINQRELVKEAGKHIVEQKHLERIEQFFKEYKTDFTEEELHTRYAGMMGSDRKQLSVSTLRKIWEEFVQKERYDYILANNTVTVDDIVNIGIDKFALTNGWTKPSDVKRWRNNKIRIGVCPNCKDQFVPLIFQVNYGLCSNCRPEFSFQATKKYIDFVGTTNERYKEASNELLMDFFIMFYTDDNFRDLFKKDSEFAKEFENKEFEVAEWLQKEKKQATQRVIESKGLEVQ